MARVKGLTINFNFNNIGPIVDRHVREAVEDQQKRMVKALEKATSAWEKPVDFETNATNDEGATISTEDKRYQWVDEGTKPHVIRPRNARMLRWLPGSNVRNEIARRQARADQRDVAMYAKEVKHPGIRPRSFTETVIRKRSRHVYKAIDDAVFDVIREFYST
jgi:hypothetical protein